MIFFNRNHYGKFSLIILQSRGLIVKILERILLINFPLSLNSLKCVAVRFFHSHTYTLSYDLKTIYSIICTKKYTKLKSLTWICANEWKCETDNEDLIFSNYRQNIVSPYLVGCITIDHGLFLWFYDGLYFVIPEEKNVKARSFLYRF